MDNRNRYAKVFDGVVVDAVVAETVPEDTDEATFVEITFTTYVDAAGNEGRAYAAGIGWDYVDGEFVDNRPVEEFEE